MPLPISVNAIASFSASVSLNTLLIYLIRTRSSREMRVYSVLLLQTCVIDLLHSGTVLLAMPMSAVVDENHIILQQGLLPHVGKGAQTQLNFTLVLLWAIVFMYHVNALPSQYIYRYLVLCR